MTNLIMNERRIQKAQWIFLLRILRAVILLLIWNNNQDYRLLGDRLVVEIENAITRERQ